MLYHLGLVDYKEALLFQRELVELRNHDLVDDTVIFLEHPDTYTAGIHTPREMLLPEFIKVERGGALTYHGPGQIVIYFIVNLKSRNMNVRDMIEWAHGKLVAFLGRYGLRAESRLGKETGVWVGNKKIASTGFAVEGFSTYHGTALNVTTDLRKFQRISPCGFDPSVMTSMESLLGQPVSIEQIKEELIKLFSPEIESQ